MPRPVPRSRVRRYPPYHRQQRGASYGTGRMPIPSEEAHGISVRAAQRVRAAAPKGPNHSADKITATWRQGIVGIHIPPAARHLAILDKGFGPFIMRGLTGKVIPIRGPGGVIAFRSAFGKSAPGRRRIIARGSDGRITETKIMWRHPGVRAMNFIVPNIHAAIDEWAGTQTPGRLMQLLSQDPQAASFFRRITRVH
jgi:hypothetical protein